MRTLTAPERPPTTDRPAARGRWIWTLTGLATVGLLAWPVVGLISHAGDGGQGDFAIATPFMTRTITVTQPVSSLSVESYGAPIQVTAGPVHRVTVTEAISYPGPGPGQPPSVTATVSDGRLTLDAPACATTGCSVGFTVAVPTGVAVTAESDDGGIAVAGVAGANLDSGGGPVRASGIDGPLSVSSEDGGITVSDVTAPSGTNLDSGGGPIQVGRVNGPLTLTSEDGGVTVNGLTGDLDADTGGGPFSGDLSSGRASVLTEDGSAALTFASAPAYVFVDTGGGPAQLTFNQPPTAVMVSTENGSASVSVPGGPYSVTADSEGGSQTVGIPTAAAAHRSLTVSTEGGPLEIVPR
jgi:Putative adhesin